MPATKETLKTLLWCLFWGLASSVWCWTSMFATGATWDEPFYLKAGLDNWHRLNHRELLDVGTMPLPAEVQTLPLFVAEKVFGADLPTSDWSRDPEPGRDPLGNFWTWLAVARLGTTLFWWLLLWATYRTAAIYAGPDAGRWALAFVACEPVLLGHASLATTDIAFAACLLSLIAAFRSRRDEPNWRRRLLCPAIWVMITFMAKASALVFVPVCLTLIELERLVSLGWRPGKDRASWQRPLASLRDLAVMAVIGMALLFIVCPRVWVAISVQIQHNLQHPPDNPLPRAPYLLGQTVSGGFWYYFPAVLAIKLGLPILITLLVLMLARPRFWLNGPSWAALGLFLLSPGFRVQLGIRMILAMVVLFMVGAAVALARWQNGWRVPGAGCRDSSDVLPLPDAHHASPVTRDPWQRTVITRCAMVLVGWSFVSCWLNLPVTGGPFPTRAPDYLLWPHGLCYTNPLWGGTDQGYLALNDASYDWGQGLKDLEAWYAPRHEQNPDLKLKVCYYATDPTLSRLDIPRITIQDAVKPGLNCYLAVSTNYLPATHVSRGQVVNPLRDFLANRQPFDRTRTFFIYDLTSSK